MSPQLILHIGLPKTGSTSIQRTLYNCRKMLARRGICYPTSPGGSLHSLVATAALAGGDPKSLRNATEWDGLPPTVRLEQFLREFDAEMKSLPASIRMVIISAEQCSMYLRRPQDVENLRVFLAPYFSSIKVVLYLRRQDSHATSVYSQTLRRGIIALPELSRVRREHAALYDYEALLEKWAAVFGRDALVPRIFERASLLNGDVVQDFVAVCGFDPSLAIDPDTSTSNPSISLHGQALLLATGRLLQQQTGKAQFNDATWKRLAAAVTEVCPGKGWQPSRDEATAFMTQFAETNEAVRRAWFPDRASLFDMDMKSLPATPISLEAPPPMDTALSVLLFSLHKNVQTAVGNQVDKARLRLDRGNPVAARARLQRAVTMDGTNVKARLALARLFADAGETAAAIAHAEAAVSAEPQNRIARILLRKLTNPPKQKEALAATH